MNQILETKSKKSKIKKYIIILTTSTLSMAIFLSIFIVNLFEQNKQKELSERLANNYKVYRLFADSNNSNLLLQDDDICGNIIIPKFNINYPFFYGLSDELLKISPCRFNGKMPNYKSNLCIIGHNYNDDRFFGNLNKLNIGDIIVIEDLNNNSFNYTVFDIFEVDEEDAYSYAVKSKHDYELTLVTCTNYNNKRLIIKAKK